MCVDNMKKGGGGKGKSGIRDTKKIGQYMTDRPTTDLLKIETFLSRNIKPCVTYCSFKLL